MELAPLKEERLRLQAEVNRLMFESALATEGQTTETPSHGENKKNLCVSVVQSLAETNGLLSNLHSLISPLQGELDRLMRQFWVRVEQVMLDEIRELGKLVDGE